MNPQSILGCTRRPDISFLRSGRIDLSSRVVRLLALRPGDVVDIIAHQGEYYLFISLRSSQAIGRHEACCYPVNFGSRYFRANSVRLCKAILQACGVFRRAALMCGEAILINGKPHLPIITRKTL